MEWAESESMLKRPHLKGDNEYATFPDNMSDIKSELVPTELDF